VLQGTGDFQVDAERRTLGAGSVVFCAAGSEHAVSNPGPERLALLVFMAPPPR
jgi:quercetin dioxygenase-like cupin family protein